MFEFKQEKNRSGLGYRRSPETDKFLLELVVMAEELLVTTILRDTGIFVENGNMNEGKIISVFGSGTVQPQEKTYSFAFELGEALAREGYVVCCGGYRGIMEALSRGARKAGGETIGVTVRSFGRANPWITREIATHSLYERLQNLIGLARGYVVLKGGTGTLVELSLSWEVMNKGIVQPPRPLIIADQCWLPVIAEFMKLVESSSSPNPHFPFPAPSFFYYADSIERILEILASNI